MPLFRTYAFLRVFLYKILCVLQLFPELRVGQYLTLNRVIFTIPGKLIIYNVQPQRQHGPVVNNGIFALRVQAHAGHDFKGLVHDTFVARTSVQQVFTGGVFDEAQAFCPVVGEDCVPFKVQGGAQD
jgi:hypothetical protein